MVEITERHEVEAAKIVDGIDLSAKLNRKGWVYRGELSVEAGQAGHIGYVYTKKGEKTAVVVRLRPFGRGEWVQIAGEFPTVDFKAAGSLRVSSSRVVKYWALRDAEKHGEWIAQQVAVGREMSNRKEYTGS